jgi:hypothetical protein
MTLGDLHSLMTENGYYICDNNDFELQMVDGSPVTGIIVDQKQGIIYLSDEEEGLRPI